jgi:Rad3-related DNA helicase
MKSKLLEGIKKQTQTDTNLRRPTLNKRQRKVNNERKKSQLRKDGCIHITEEPGIQSGRKRYFKSVTGSVNQEDITILINTYIITEFKNTKQKTELVRRRSRQIHYCWLLF